MSAETKKVMGYLPNDVPPIGQIILLGFQHALTMFPATVLVALLVGFLAGVVFTGIMAIPYSSFYIRTPEMLLGRVNSLGAGMGFIIIALASLFFGWLINATSARAGILVCAILMGLIALGVWLFPFMKHLDEKVAPEGVSGPTNGD